VYVLHTCFIAFVSVVPLTNGIVCVCAELASASGCAGGAIMISDGEMMRRRVGEVGG